MILFQLFSDLSHPESTSHNGSGGVSTLVAEDITTEGFGNNHIDFIQHIGQAGEREIPVVEASFCAYQGQLVVGNKYATAMVEENMDKGGFENDIAGCSCVTKEVAARAIQMLKNQMMGVAVNAAPKK